MTVLSHNVRMNDTKTKMISLNVTFIPDRHYFFVFIQKIC